MPCLKVPNHFGIAVCQVDTWNPAPFNFLCFVKFLCAIELDMSNMSLCIHVPLHYLAQLVCLSWISCWLATGKKKKKKKKTLTKNILSFSSSVVIEELIRPILLNWFQKKKKKKQSYKIFSTQWSLILVSASYFHFKRPFRTGSLVFTQLTNYRARHWSSLFITQVFLGYHLPKWSPKSFCLLISE